MRLYINELIKAFCKKSTIAILLVLTILNGVLLWVNNNQNSTIYPSSAYKQIFEDLEDIPTDKALETVQNQYDKLQIFQSLSYGEDASYLLDENSSLDISQLTKEYKSNQYLVYTDDLFSETMLYSDVFKEVKSCDEYSDYLSNIDVTAKKMTGISIFAEPDTFSYRNIAKTPDDFAHLKENALEVGSSKGVKMATSFLATDIIALLMIIVVVVSIVTREKELSQLGLAKTCYKGRFQLGLAKLFTCFTAGFLSLILLYAVNFSVSYFTYGFGNLGRYIQSVYGFNGSNLSISVLEYFVLFLVAKLGVYCVAAGLLYLITVISKSSVQVYAMLVIVLAIESVLYYTILSTSWLCVFKHINIVAYLNTSDLFSSYLNLNIAGYPVNYLLVFIISASILLLAFSVISVVVFARQKSVQSRSRFLSKIHINILRGRTTNVFFHELYKIFIGGKVLFILLAFGFVVWYTYAPMQENFTSADDVYYKQYMVKLQGEYTNEKQIFIDSEEEKFQSTQLEMADAMAKADAENQIFVMMKYQDILAPQNAFEQVKAHCEYLKTTDNGEFVYDTGYKLLTGDESAGTKDLTLGLTAMAMVICCLVYVYSVEFQTGANVLLKTNFKGREDTFLCKLIISAVIVTIIFVLTYAPFFYNVLSTYGTAGINSPACSIENLSRWGISIKGYLILISVFRYIALLSAMLLIFFLSTKLKSVISTLLASTAILVLPILLSLLGIKFFDYVLLNLLIIGNV